MTDHSPDHAERARQMLADRGRFPSGGEVPFDVTLSLIAAALRDRDRVVEAEDLAAIDAILNRWRLNSDAARPSIKLGLLRRLRAALHDAKVMREEGNG